MRAKLIRNGIGLMVMFSITIPALGQQQPVLTVTGRYDDNSNLNCCMMAPGGIASWKLRQLKPDGSSAGVVQKKRFKECVGTAYITPIPPGEGNKFELEVELWANQAKGPIHHFVIDGNITDNTVTITQTD